MQSRLIATATPTCDLGIAVADIVTVSLHRVYFVAPDDAQCRIHFLDGPYVLDSDSIPSLYMV